MGAARPMYGTQPQQPTQVPAQGGKGGVQQPQVQQPAQVPAQGGKTPNANGTYTGQLSPQMSPYIDAMRPQVFPAQPQVQQRNPQEVYDAYQRQRNLATSAGSGLSPVYQPPPGQVPPQGGKGNRPLPSHYQSPYANYGFDPGLQSYLDQQNYGSSNDMGVAFQYDPTNQSFTGGTMAGNYNPIPLNVMQQVAGGNRDVLNPYFQSKFPQPTGPMPQPTRVAGPPPLPLSAYNSRQRSPVAQRNFDLARQAQSSGPLTNNQIRLRETLERGGRAAANQAAQQQGLMGLQNMLYGIR
jgi:hypothetical protein